MSIDMKVDVDSTGRCMLWLVGPVILLVVRMLEIFLVG